MTKIFFAGRIPEALNEHVTEYAKALGKTRTRILVEALAQYTDFSLTTRREDSDSSPFPKLVEQLQQQVKEHQERLNTHAEELKLIKNQLIDNLDNNVIKTENTVISSDQNLSKAKIEKIENEKKEDRVIQLSVATWNCLNEIARQQGISQADIIEYSMNQSQKDIDEAVKILRKVLASREKALGALKNLVKDALAYLDKTQNFKKS